MKLAIIVLLFVSCLLVLTKALPVSSESTQPGMPTSLLEEEVQQSIQDEQDLSPLAREKRHKKKIIVVNQYPGGYGSGGCRGCNGGYGHGAYSGGYGYNYPNNYGYSGYNNYGYSGYNSGYGYNNYGHGGGGHGKFKKG